MTPDEIAAARKLCDAVLPGPWSTGDGFYAREVRDAHGDQIAWCSDALEGVALGNARFIAASRTLLPAALDALELARRERDEARAEWRVAVAAKQTAEDRARDLAAGGAFRDLSANLAATKTALAEAIDLLGMIDTPQACARIERLKAKVQS